MTKQMLPFDRITAVQFAAVCTHIKRERNFDKWTIVKEGSYTEGEKSESEWMSVAADIPFDSVRCGMDTVENLLKFNANTTNSEQIKFEIWTEALRIGQYL